MQKVMIVLLSLSTAYLLATRSPASAAVQAQDEEEEQEISLDAVPQNVLDAAREAVEGIEFTEAEVEAVLVYELEGTVGEQEFEVEVTAEGNVIEIESGEDDDTGESAGEPENEPEG